MGAAMNSDTRPSAPAPAPDPRGLGHPLTFFVTAAQRGAILRALRRVDRDRSRALMRVLRVSAG